MESTPEEIWLLIFKFVHDGVSKAGPRGSQVNEYLARAASIRPLSETCRTFHRICQPLLFETLVIQSSLNPSRWVVDVLQSKPHLKSMVSKVRIGWTLSGREREQDRWDRLEKVLMELCSVRDVWIWRADIQRVLFHHFQRCPRLESLVLINVSTIDSTETTLISLDSLKYLRYEPTHSLGSTRSFPALILPKLETLQIGSVFLSGSTDSFKHQVFRFNRSVLTELVIVPHPCSDGESMEAGLVQLLKRAHGIRSLSLDGVPKLESSRSPNLADDLIPELEAFRGRLKSVLTICKSRSVRNLVTWFPVEPISTLTDHVTSLVRPGSVPLEHLSIDWIPWNDDTMGYIAQHSPELVSLKIRANLIDGTLSARYSMPQLPRATFLSSKGSWFSSGSNSNLKVEREVKVVEECREFWIQVEYLRLDPGYFWSYRGPEVERVQGEEEEWY